MPDTGKKMSEIPYSSITAIGSDAFEFLQAQLTADLNNLGEESSAATIRSAWCNPKGRVICLFTVAAVKNGFELTLPSDLTDLVVQRLTMFRFRSKVEFSVVADRENGGDSAVDMLRAGQVEVALAQSEKFTPHMLNLDLLGVISLDKGCYPGQEIVARTHYRGASKRRLLRFESAAPVAAGDKVSNGDRDIGEVVNAIGTDLLAVVPVDSASDSLTVGKAQLTHIVLPYLD
jgi:folate-binding protein YgfZ